jgi:hypothetical protein
MEKRRHPRFIKRLETIIAIDNISFRSISSDLSENGLFIRTKRGVTVDTPIDIELSLPGNKISFLKGIVRRTIRTQVPTMKNGMGIEIIEKDKTFTDFVKSIDEERNENGAEEHVSPELPLISSLNCEVTNINANHAIPERRRYKRVKVEHMEVNCDMPSASYMKIIDISKNGVFVKTDRKLDIGKKYALKIEYEKNVLFAKASVVWSLLDEEGEYTDGRFHPIYFAGMQFADFLKGEIADIMGLIEVDLHISCPVSVY